MLGATRLQSAKAEPQHHRTTGVVVITGQEVYPDDGKYFIQVFSVSSGSNSPAINNGADLAQTLEYLKTLGYRVTPLPNYLSFYCERD